MLHAMRSLALAGLTATVAALWAAPAHALLIQQSEQFSPVGSPTTQITFAAFDASLGTLDRAVLQFSGILTLTLQTPPLLDAETGLPLPYDFDALATQRFAGLGNFSGFGFSSPAQFQIASIVASGAGEALTLSLPFSYTMTFTPASNSTGLATLDFTGPTLPPPTVTGTLDMFIAPAGASSLLAIGQTAAPPISLGEIGLVRSQAIMAGSGILTFDYTAAPPPELPRPIPEPPVAALLLAAALGAGTLRSRPRQP